MTQLVPQSASISRVTHLTRIASISRVKPTSRLTSISKITSISKVTSLPKSRNFSTTLSCKAGPGTGTTLLAVGFTAYLSRSLYVALVGAIITCVSLSQIWLLHGGVAPGNIVPELLGGAYVNHVMEFSRHIIININTYDINTLREVLPYIGELIREHELVFNGSSVFINDLEYTASPLFETYDLLFENWREAGNALTHVYRVIEAALEIPAESSLLPGQWYED